MKEEDAEDADDEERKTLEWKPSSTYTESMSTRFDRKLSSCKDQMPRLGRARQLGSASDMEEKFSACLKNRI